MYRHILSLLCSELGIDDLSPQRNIDAPLFYFCMERWDVWDSLLGASPASIYELDYLFARSLQHRFFHHLPVPKQAFYTPRAEKPGW